MLAMAKKKGAPADSKKRERDESTGTSSASVKKSTFSAGKSPVDFMIIGVQKAGTSAAVVNLTKHESIWLKPGQVHFFDRWYSKGLGYYQSIMRPTVKNIKLVGEKTPTYIYCDGCLDRIKAACPDCKFILFLRDPVARAYSHWNMLKHNMKQEELSFADAVDREMTSLLKEPKNFGTALFHYVQRGFYMDQIEEFLKRFKRDQLLVVIAERIRENTMEEHNRIFSFLGVDPVDKFHSEDVHLGKYTEKISDRMKEKLRAIYQPHNERLFEFLGKRIPEWES
jgi:hypothetical protein